MKSFGFRGVRSGKGFQAGRRENWMMKLDKR